ncbi:MAG: hypothetical protein GX786_01975, partial [Clostridiales bacterium]|nr:hypothetical protein [Clostridiales bacterium]
MFAHVIVDIAHENVAKTFTYKIPDSLEVQRGSRVLVPFGPRKIEGIVLAVTQQGNIPLEKTKEILHVLDKEPTILPDLILLAEEMAQKAHCPLAETLRLMYPAALRGGRIKTQKEWMAVLTIPAGEVEKAISQNKRSGKRQALLALLKEGNATKVTDLKMLVKDPMAALKKLKEMGLIDLYEQEVLRSPSQ